MVFAPHPLPCRAGTVVACQRALEPVGMGYEGCGGVCRCRVWTVVRLVTRVA